MLFTDNIPYKRYMELPKSKIKRVYLVNVVGPFSELKLKSMNQKIYASIVYQKPKVSLIHSNKNKHTLRFELIEGKNREIRNICKIFNLKVEKLRRVSYGKFYLKTVPHGKFKEMIIMKVISGKLKGRAIQINKKGSYRPTLSRIREDLFNLIKYNSILNISLSDSTFIDLFSGSGSVGIEALSQGAKKVIFNDKDQDNLFYIKNFVVRAGLKNYELHNYDSYNLNLSILKDVDIAFVDPPYDHNLQLIEENIYTKIRKESLLILETNQKYSHSEIILEKKIKNKYLYFLKKSI